MRRAIGLVLQPDAGERGVDALAQRVAAQPEVGRPEGDVGAHVGHEELVVGVLEDDPDAAADLGARARGQLEAADADRPVAALEHPVELQDERRLAGAVGAEDRDALADRDAQVDAGQGRAAVRVGEAQAAHVERRRRSRRDLDRRRRPQPGRASARARCGASGARVARRARRLPRAGASPCGVSEIGIPTLSS